MTGGSDEASGAWPVVTILGPTAVGKSALAVALAERLPVDLISVDSAAVYRGMDVGTAKPSAALRARHPHALVDIREPDAPYSAADFRSDALRCIAAARAAGRVPVLVGGTMLYMKVLEEGIARMPPSDPAIRAQLDAREASEGLAALQAELAVLDPVAAERIDPRNAQRVKRALEVHAISGRPISAFWAEQAVSGEDLRGLVFLRNGLVPDDRAALHRVIAERFDAMLAAGLVEEVRALLARGLSRDLPAMRAVGYRQVAEFLEGEGEGGEDGMRERGIAATRQLARRQLTWMRGWPGLDLQQVSAGGEPGGAQADALLMRIEAALSRARGAA